MSIQDELKSRRDVDNADIPNIIERAERLRQQAISTQDARKQKSTVEEVQRIGNELSIPSKYVEKAINDIRTERQKRKQSKQQKIHDRKKTTQAIAKSIRILGMVIGAIVLFRGIEWFWVAMDFTSSIDQPEPTVIVEERIIKETVLRTVQTTPDSEPTVKEVNDSQKKDPEKERPTSPKKSTLTPEQPAVLETINNNQAQSEKTKKNEQKQKLSNLSVNEPTAKQLQPQEPIVEEIENKQVQIEEPEIHEPIVKEPDVKKQIPKPSSKLPKLKRKLEGEWVLDGYLLYEKGVEFPMMVPIVYEPLELPKTWRFSSGKYKRVMDAQLSFSARFDVETLPDNLRPVVDDPGEWGQIIASNVVSTIPGIRRQNDYFAVLVGQDTLTIWYLGPNAYRKKLPSQAEVYRKR